MNCDAALNRGMFVAVMAIMAGGCVTSMATVTASGEPTRTTLFAQYDRVRGETRVSTIVFIRTNVLFGPSVQLDLVLPHADTALAAPAPGVLVMFTSSSGTQTSGWQFLRNNDLALLIDGETRLAYEGVHDGEVGTIVLKEAIGFHVPTDDILRIGRARRVEGALGSWRFELKPEEIAKFREMGLYASLDPEAPIPPLSRR